MRLLPYAQLVTCLYADLVSNAIQRDLRLHINVTLINILHCILGLINMVNSIWLSQRTRRGDNVSKVDAATFTSFPSYHSIL